MAVKFKRMIALKQKIHDFILKLIKANVKRCCYENICVERVLILQHYIINFLVNKIVRIATL